MTKVEITFEKPNVRLGVMGLVSLHTQFIASLESCPPKNREWHGGESHALVGIMAQPTHESLMG